MSKFKVSVKLQGLEIEVEGTRDDIPLITANVGQQVAGLLQPVADIVEGEVPVSIPTQREAASQPSPDGKRKPARRRRVAPAATATSAQGGSTEQALTWRHDPDKWGVPRQEWGPGNKILYLMYVAKNETARSDLPAPTIANAFNTLFRQAGLLNARNMARDLGRLKSRGGLVSEDRSQTPNVWFLTQNGESAAQQLVNEALGRAPVTAASPDDEAGEADSE